VRRPAAEPDGRAQPSALRRASGASEASARATVGLGEIAQPLDAGEDAPLAVVEPLLDVGREEIAPAGGPDAERHRDGVVRLVADRDGDPAHPELLGAGGARPWRRTRGWPVGSRSISMSRQPMPRTPRPSTFDTASLAAQRPAMVSGRPRT
jgi:hypothetical protein